MQFHASKNHGIIKFERQTQKLYLKLCVFFVVYARRTDDDNVVCGGNEILLRSYFQSPKNTQYGLTQRCIVFKLWYKKVGYILQNICVFIRLNIFRIMATSYFDKI